MANCVARLRFLVNSSVQKKLLGTPAITLISNRTFSKTAVRQSDEEEEKVLDPKKRYFTFHSVETSIRYMQSDVFKQTYRDALVWEPYRRNHKGALPPKKTRSKCIRGNVVATGNPCPICRDEYLVVDPKNVELLKQFTSPQSGLLFSYTKTGVCQAQYRKLQHALEQAWDQGLIEKPLPHRTFDYSQFYPDHSDTKSQ